MKQTAQQSKSHYDVLGVSPGADAAAIKRAFRKRASEAHPDKGGDTAEMSALNRAYEVLGDPQRRLRYDELGTDEQAKPMETEARTVLMQVFSQLLGSGQEMNYVEQAKKALRGKLAEIEGNLSNVRAKQADFKHRRGKVKARKGENFFHMLVDQQLATMENAMRNGELAQEVMRCALSMLEDYEGEDVRQAAVMFFSSGSTTASW